VGSAQDDARGFSGLEGFLPTPRTQAPAISRFETGKAKIRHRRGKIITTGFGEREKLSRGEDADGVTAHVFGTRIAAAIAIEARHRCHRTRFERISEHVQP
jgi:hypothetical protein